MFLSALCVAFSPLHSFNSSPLSSPVLSLPPPLSSPSLLQIFAMTSSDWSDYEAIYKPLYTAKMQLLSHLLKPLHETQQEQQQQQRKEQREQQAQQQQQRKQRQQQANVINNGDSNKDSKKVSSDNSNKTNKDHENSAPQLATLRYINKYGLQALSKVCSLSSRSPLPLPLSPPSPFSSRPVAPIFFLLV